MDRNRKAVQTRLLEARRSVLAQLGQCAEERLGHNPVEYWFAVQMRNRLDRIDQALARLVEGRYGLCRSCRIPIDPARLRSMPEAELCLGCQSRMEHGCHQPSLRTPQISS